MGAGLEFHYFDLVLWAPDTSTYLRIGFNENKSSSVVNHAAFIHRSVSQKAQIEKYYQKREKQNKK